MLKSFLDSKIRLTVSIVLVIAGLLIVFNEVGLQPVRVALPWLHQAQFAGIYVANSKGYYKNEGIAVSLIERDLKGSSVVDLLSEGKVDVAIMSPGEFLHAANDGKDIVALAAVFQTTPTVIASIEKTGIRSPKDLKGKRVGISKVSEESKLLIYALLQGEQISKNSITFSEVGYNQVDALLRGEVDAVSIYRINELYELKSKNVSYSLLFPERLGVDMYGDIIVVSKEYLLNNKREIGGFLNATFKGWKFAEEDPDEAVRITLKVDNSKYHDAGREEYILKNALSMIRLSPKQTMGQMVHFHWNYMYELFRKNGLVNEIDLNKYFIDALTYRELGFPK